MFIEKSTLLDQRGAHSEQGMADKVLQELAAARGGKKAPAAPDMLLAPASVMNVDGQRLLLALDGRQVWAQSALVHYYRPAIGDQVLAIGPSEACFVIGVLHGAGTVNLCAPGDIEIHAPRGQIGLLAKHGVHIKSDAISLTANRLTVAARSLIERFTDVSRWVKQACQLRAGRLRITVEDDYRLRADRIQQQAERDVKIDGSKIHLG